MLTTAKPIDKLKYARKQKKVPVHLRMSCRYDVARQKHRLFIISVSIYL